MEPTQEAQSAPPPTKKGKQPLYLKILLLIGILMILGGAAAYVTSNRPPERPALHALVEANAFQLQITVTNDYDWHDAIVTVNEKWSVRIDRLPALGTYQIGFARLTDETGERFGMRVVKKVEVECTEGTESWSFE